MKNEKASVDLGRSLVCRHDEPREVHARSSGLRRFSRASALGWELGRLCGSFFKWCGRLVRDLTRWISVEYTLPAGVELATVYDAAEHWHDRLDLLGYPRAYEDLFDRLLANGVLRPLRDGGRVLDCGRVPFRRIPLQSASQYWRKQLD